MLVYRQHSSDPSTMELASIHGGDLKVVATFFPAILPGDVRGNVLMAHG